VAAWYIAIVNQFGWGWIAIGEEQWGLLVSSVVFFGLGIWNAISWTKDPPRKKMKKSPNDGKDAMANESIGEMEIQKRFNYFPHNSESATVMKSQKHLTAQILYIEMARALDILLPPGREKVVAFTELESSSMWTHKSIQDAIETEIPKPLNPGKNPFQK
jgi:hypothetical protein